MNRNLIKLGLLVLGVAAFLLGITWFVLRKIDPTSSAEFISDSPDGKYRCAVFCKDNIVHGNPEYSAALFEGRWPHRELPGTRVEWNNDSLGSSDFRATWLPDGVDINYRNGKGDNRDTVSGRIVGGSQKWIGP